MAGNRVHIFGTIASRVEGLLRSGAMAAESAPIWLAVYRAFPPHVEPKLNRPVPEKAIRNILYPEDYIRARYYERFGSGPVVGVINTLNQTGKNMRTNSQVFVDRYIEIARSDHTLDADVIFEKTADAVAKDNFRQSSEDRRPARSGRPVVQSEESRKRPSISEIILSDD